MNRSIPHEKLCREIEAALSRIDVLTTPNITGTFLAPSGAYVKVGAFSIDGHGGPDLLAVRRRELFELCDDVYVPVTVGALTGIEAKTGKATQTPEQRACQRRLERVGVRYVVARDVESVVRVVGGMGGSQ